VPGIQVHGLQFLTGSRRLCVSKDDLPGVIFARRWSGNRGARKFLQARTCATTAAGYAHSAL